MHVVVILFAHYLIVGALYCGEFVHYLMVFHRIHSGGEKVPLCNLFVFVISPFKMVSEPGSEFCNDEYGEQFESK